MNINLSKSDYYLVKKAGSGETLSREEENRFADLATKHCGKSEKSGDALDSNKKNESQE